MAIAYEDVPNGASVLYRAPGGEPGLRERTREVARFHNSSEGKTGKLHDLSSIPHRAYAEDIEGGARLALVAKSVRRGDVDRLRWHVQQEVFIMQSAGCERGHEAL